MIIGYDEGRKEKRRKEEEEEEKNRGVVDILFEGAGFRDCIQAPHFWSNTSLGWAL